MKDKQSGAIYLDPSGDLSLFVGYEDQATKSILTETFVVATKAMCLASPVWRAMFDPEGYLAKQSPGNKKYLMTDDPHALLILLRIAHLQFRDLATEVMTYEKFLQLAVLCDKYDMTNLISPWISKWHETLHGTASSLDYNGYENWLFIAWTYGNEELFKEITRNLVLTSTVKCSGQLVNGLGSLVRDTMPPGSLGM